MRNGYTASVIQHMNVHLLSCDLQVKIAQNACLLNRSFGVERDRPVGNVLQFTCETEDDTAATLTLKLDEDNSCDTYKGIVWINAMVHQIEHCCNILSSLILGDIMKQ